MGRKYSACDVGFRGRVAAQIGTCALSANSDGLFFVPPGVRNRQYACFVSFYWPCGRAEWDLRPLSEFRLRENMDLMMLAATSRQRRGKKLSCCGPRARGCILEFVLPVSAPPVSVKPMMYSRRGTTWPSGRADGTCALPANSHCIHAPTAEFVLFPPSRESQYGETLLKMKCPRFFPAL